MASDGKSSDSSHNPCMYIVFYLFSRFSFFLLVFSSLGKISFFRAVLLYLICVCLCGDGCV